MNVCILVDYVLNKYLHAGGQHLMASEDELHGPWPAVFSAETLNSYS